LIEQIEKCTFRTRGSLYFYFCKSAALFCRDQNCRMQNFLNGKLSKSKDINCLYRKISIVEIERYQLSISKDINCQYRKISIVNIERYQLSISKDINCQYQKISIVNIKRYKLSISKDINCRNRKKRHIVEKRRISSFRTSTHFM
jgi:hypothetical protein